MLVWPLIACGDAITLFSQGSASMKRIGDIFEEKPEIYDREDIKQGMKTILDGIELLKKGTSIYIAPEGTRSKNDEVHKFHEASFKLADKSKTPIVPVCINNTDALFEKHEPWIHSGHVIIEYCEPIYMSDMDRDEKKHIGEKVRAIISEKYKKNAKEI